MSTRIIRNYPGLDSKYLDFGKHNVALATTDFTFAESGAFNKIRNLVD